MMLALAVSYEDVFAVRVGGIKHNSNTSDPFLSHNCDLMTLCTHYALT